MLDHSGVTDPQCLLPTLIVGLAVSTGCQPRNPEAATLIGELRTQGTYSDVHGNWPEPLVDLALMRFEASAVLRHEIDRVARSPNVNERYLRALCEVLGFIKDPGSIPWLEKRICGPRGSLVFDAWLTGWLGRQVVDPLFGYMNQAFLASDDQWARFFHRHLEDEGDPVHRSKLLRVLSAYFHRDSTFDLFDRIQQDPTTEAQCVFLVDAYLFKHGRPVVAAQLEAAIARIDRQDLPRRSRRTPRASRCRHRRAA